MIIFEDLIEISTKAWEKIPKKTNNIIVSLFIKNIRYDRKTKNKIKKRTKN